MCDACVGVHECVCDGAGEACDVCVSVHECVCVCVMGQGERPSWAQGGAGGCVSFVLLVHLLLLKNQAEK